MNDENLTQVLQGLMCLLGGLGLFVFLGALDMLIKPDTTAKLAEHEADEEKYIEKIKALEAQLAAARARIKELESDLEEIKYQAHLGDSQ